jgi:hypothetical protein
LLHCRIWQTQPCSNPLCKPVEHMGLSHCVGSAGSRVVLDCLCFNPESGLC